MLHRRNSAVCRGAVAGACIQVPVSVRGFWRRLLGVRIPQDAGRDPGALRTAGTTLHLLVGLRNFEKEDD